MVKPDTSNVPYCLPEPYPRRPVITKSVKFPPCNQYCCCCNKIMWPVTRRRRSHRTATNHHLGIHAPPPVPTTGEYNYNYIHLNMPQQQPTPDNLSHRCIMCMQSFGVKMTLPAQKAMKCKTLLQTFAPNTNCSSERTHNSVTVVTPTVHHPHQCRRTPPPDTLLQRCVSVPPYSSQAKTMSAQRLMLCKNLQRHGAATITCCWVEQHKWSCDDP